MRRWILACGLLGTCVVGVWGAGCGTVTCEDDRTCAGLSLPTTDAAGSETSVIPDAQMVADAGSDVVVRPDGGACDGTKRPNEDGCVPSDGTGLFVDPKGNDTTGTGTKLKPFASIGGAIAKATGTARIYACEGTYGALTIDSKPTGAITVFGGLSCTTWGFTGGKTRIAPTLDGPALRMDSVAVKVEFADVEIEAPAAKTSESTGEGKSSIGAFISNSKGVTFRRCLLKANAGAPGTAGAAPVEFASAVAPGSNGAGATPGAGQTNSCSPIDSTGGVGGGKNSDGQNGGPSGLPVDPATFSGSGGTLAACSGTGTRGANGSFGPGGAGGSGASQSGKLTLSSWLPGRGADGAPGSAAQGGGGGGGDTVTAGGGGGAGGCGGTGGGAGAGGGASVAVLAFKSPVVLASSTLISGAGGKGGNGAVGKRGQAAALTHSTGSCGGGFGGHGGSGGGGGGGAGGVSLGIGYTGTPPAIDGATITEMMTLPIFTGGVKGLAGAKGLGGAPVVTQPDPSKPGADGTPGVDGAAQAVLALPE